MPRIGSHSKRAQTLRPADWDGHIFLQEAIKQSEAVQTFLKQRLVEMERSLVEERKTSEMYERHWKEAQEMADELGESLRSATDEILALQESRREKDAEIRVLRRALQQAEYEFGQRVIAGRQDFYASEYERIQREHEEGAVDDSSSEQSSETCSTLDIHDLDDTTPNRHLRAPSPDPTRPPPPPPPPPPPTNQL